MKLYRRDLNSASGEIREMQSSGRVERLKYGVNQDERIAYRIPNTNLQEPEKDIQHGTN